MQAHVLWMLLQSCLEDNNGEHAFECCIADSGLHNYKNIIAHKTEGMRMPKVDITRGVGPCIMCNLVNP